MQLYNIRSTVMADERVAVQPFAATDGMHFNVSEPQNFFLIAIASPPPSACFVTLMCGQDVIDGPISDVFLRHHPRSG